MSLEEILERLKLEYLESFSYKIDELNKKIDENKQKEVVSLFHQIHGSGKTYGFNHFSDLAYKAEYEVSKAQNWKLIAKNYCDLLAQALDAYQTKIAS